MSISFPLISINGSVGGLLSPLDRGFAYGDGVFETCRIINKTVPLWDWHQDRLKRSCTQLKIPVDIDLLMAYQQQLLSLAAVEDGVLKVIVTRGSGGRGYGLPVQVAPTYCLIICPRITHPAHQLGVTVRVCDQRLAENPSLAGIKHLNRLDNVLARAEWQDDSAAEGLLLNQAGNLIEATASNIFIVRNRELLTPDLSRAGVAGVTRRIICEQLAPAMKLAIIETRLSIHDLEGADEVFICNSINGIWPVTRLLDHTPGVFPVGEYTRQLQVALDDFILQKSLQAGAAQ